MASVEVECSTWKVGGYAVVAYLEDKNPVTHEYSGHCTISESPDNGMYGRSAKVPNRTWRKWLLFVKVLDMWH